ncbi:hypothetical protein C8J56DRAFT_957399 [Mycena floridula]|nr:hypothetical protein C8J56DRAFT_957399 [Mycena floridula]
MITTMTMTSVKWTLTPSAITTTITAVALRSLYPTVMAALIPLRIPLLQVAIPRVRIPTMMAIAMIAKARIIMTRITPMEALTRPLFLIPN